MKDIIIPLLDIIKNPTPQVLASFLFVSMLLNVYLFLKYEHRENQAPTQTLVTTDTPEQLSNYILKTELLPKVKKAKEEMVEKPGEYATELERLFKYLIESLDAIAVYPSGKPLDTNQKKQLEQKLREAL